MTARINDVGMIYTENTGDFEKFEFLKVENPPQDYRMGESGGLEPTDPFGTTTSG